VPAYLVRVACSSIVDDNIRATVQLDGLLQDFLPIFATSHVGFDCCAPKFFGDCLPALRIHFRDEDFGALMDEFGRNGLSKPASTASDNRDFTFETAGHLAEDKVQSNSFRANVLGAVLKVSDKHVLGVWIAKV
jgi:hypothetical protein